MCAIFFSYQGKNENIFLIISALLRKFYISSFFSKHEFQLQYAIVMFIFAQIWNNCRVGTGYINRQIFTIHIILHFILAYFLKTRNFFSGSKTHLYKHLLFVFMWLLQGIYLCKYDLFTKYEKMRSKLYFPSTKYTWLVIWHMK